MDTMNATNARKNLYRLIEELSKSHEPIHISSRKGSAVLIAEEDWKSIQETLYLLSIPGMRESIKEGMSTPIEKCSETIEW
ncbi:MAG: type II toxin-antitoxin system Phd/YefM family antitoxin [Spirochaetes bacterium]|nr:type II toxin-antitoxin system Phd/YefM family antitoxin [Spirochaetota bacterium]MCK5570882.1 type II toxin-antitoxin system Phd/YefM family antitoxin [Spirochaetota bacterium]